MFLWFISHSIILQLWRLFQERITPHQFGILTFGGYEAIFFGIWTLLELHPNWVVMQDTIQNTFNKVFWVAIFGELCDVKGPLVNIFPFTKLFYGACSFFYYQHGRHVKGVTIIESPSGMMQGDLLGGLSFVLAHYWTILETIMQASDCVFPSLIDDTHIMGLWMRLLVLLTTFSPN
jgi:hypothetical protein